MVLVSFYQYHVLTGWVFCRHCFYSAVSLLAVIYAAAVVVVSTFAAVNVNLFPMKAGSSSIPRNLVKKMTRRHL